MSNTTKDTEQFFSIPNILDVAFVQNYWINVFLKNKTRKKIKKLEQTSNYTCSHSIVGTHIETTQLQRVFLLLMGPAGTKGLIDADVDRFYTRCREHLPGGSY